MKNNQKGIVHFQVFAVLAVVVIAIGYVAINVSNEAKRQLREDAGVSSKAAADSYFGSSIPAANQATTTGGNTQTANVAAKPSSKAISGNANPNVKPTLSPQVAPPKTSIDSIRAFFAAAKSGDFVTANALMGPKLAGGLAKLSNTVDPAQALQACNNNSTCKLVLFSFQPPANGDFKTKTYTAASGNSGEQISFPLSKSSPLIASQLGDYNIDIFSEKYAGDIWVIQDIYINGKTVENFFTTL